MLLIGCFQQNNGLKVQSKGLRHFRDRYWMAIWRSDSLQFAAIFALIHPQNAFFTFRGRLWRTILSKVCQLQGNPKQICGSRISLFFRIANADILATRIEKRVNGELQIRENGWLRLILFFAVVNWGESGYICFLSQKKMTFCQKNVGTILDLWTYQILKLWKKSLDCIRDVPT